MEESPRPVQFDIAPPVVEHRDPTGWYALVAIFTILIGLQIFSGLRTKPSDSLASPEYDQLLKAGVMSRTLKGSLSKDQQESLKDQNPFEDPIAVVVEKKATDPQAAIYYAAMRFESGKEVTAKDVAVLSGSKKPELKAFGAIYAEPKLTLARAEALAKELPEDGYVFELAAVHAKERAGDAKARDAIASPGKALSMAIGILFMFGLLFVGSALVIAYYTLRKDEKNRPVGHPSQSISLAQADKYAIRAAQLIGLYAALSLVGGWAPVPGVWANIIVFGGLVFFALYLTKIPVQGLKIGMPQLGLTNRDIRKDIGWGIGAAVANMPIVLFLGLLSRKLFFMFPQPPHPLTTKLSEDQSFFVVAFALFMASVCAPIFEEFLFRGHLFPALAKVRGSVVYGVVLSSFLFAALHPTGIPSWLPLAGVGAMGCFLTIQRGSLLPAIVMHATHNLLTLLTVLLLQ